MHNEDVKERLSTEPQQTANEPTVVNLHKKQQNSPISFAARSDAATVEAISNTARHVSSFSPRT